MPPAPPGERLRGLRAPDCRRSSRRPGRPGPARHRPEPALRERPAAPRLPPRREPSPRARARRGLRHRRRSDRRGFDRSGSRLHGRGSDLDRSDRGRLRRSGRNRCGGCRSHGRGSRSRRCDRSGCRSHRDRRSGRRGCDRGGRSFGSDRSGCRSHRDRSSGRRGCDRGSRGRGHSGRGRDGDRGRSRSRRHPRAHGLGSGRRSCRRRACRGDLRGLLQAAVLVRARRGPAAVLDDGHHRAGGPAAVRNRLLLGRGHHPGRRARGAGPCRGARAPAGDRAPGQVPRRVLRLAVDPSLEVQVRAGAAPGAADVADHLALLDARALRGGEARHMGVARRELAGVRDADDVPVAALLAGEADASARRGPDGRAGGGRDVDPVVVAPPARTEGRALGSLDGRRDRGRAAAPVAGYRRLPGLRGGSLDIGAAAIGGLRVAISGRGGRAGGALVGFAAGALSGAGLARIGLARGAAAGARVAAVVERVTAGIALRGQCLTRLDDAALDALLDRFRDPVAAGRRRARALLEHRRPRGGTDDAVHLESGPGLVLAHCGVGLRAEHAVHGHTESLLDMRHQLTLTADLERKAALADLDRPVGRGLGGDGGLQVARHLGGGHGGAGSGEHGAGQSGGHVALARVLAPCPGQKLSTPA